jgi:hypothetical protein
MRVPQWSQSRTQAGRKLGLGRKHDWTRAGASPLRSGRLPPLRAPHRARPTATVPRPWPASRRAITSATPGRPATPSGCDRTRATPAPSTSREHPAPSATYIPCRVDPECGPGFECNRGPYTHLAAAAVACDTGRRWRLESSSTGHDPARPSWRIAGWCSRFSLPCASDTECPSGLTSKRMYEYPPCTAGPGRRLRCPARTPASAAIHAPPPVLLARVPARSWGWRLDVGVRAAASWAAAAIRTMTQERARTQAGHESVGGSTAGAGTAGGVLRRPRWRRRGTVADAALGFHPGEVDEDR